MSLTPIADMVEQMLSGGNPPDMIVLAIRTAEQNAINSRLEDPTAARRRAWDRENKRAKRAVCPPDNDKTLSLSSLPSSSLNKKERKEERKKERKSGNVCPPDFHPTSEHYVIGQTLNASRRQVDSMADDMRSWSAANANRAVARKADWNLTFTGWMKRTMKPTGGGNGHKRRSISEVAAERVARAEEQERTLDLGPADYCDTGVETGERSGR